MKAPIPKEVVNEWFERVWNSRDSVISGMSFVTVRDGKITEGWDCWDFGSLTTTLSSPSA